MTARVLSLGLALATLLVAGCGDNEVGPPPLETIQGSWELQTIERNDGTFTNIVNLSAYTAVFETDGRVSARADCNNCNSTYSTNGASLTIGAMACTRAFCGEASFSDEYIAALDGATSWEGSRNELRLIYPGGTLSFLAAN